MGIARGSSSLPIRTNLNFNDLIITEGQKQAVGLFFVFFVFFAVVLSKAAISLDENRVSLYNALLY